MAHLPGLAHWGVAQSWRSRPEGQWRLLSLSWIWILRQTSIFFDLAGTIDNLGVIDTVATMDYIFCPITADNVVLKVHVFNQPVE